MFRWMKKYGSVFIFVFLFFNCSKELVEKPDNLIDKKVMSAILYDLSLLEALKYQNANVLYSNGVNPKTYVFKKYKIDSLQFAQSNAYYAADYRSYKKMFEDLETRLKNEKNSVDLLIKKEQKKAIAIKKTIEKKKLDSIKKAKDSLGIVNKKQ
jgi:Domain of unknown function (DUF4296)